MNILFTHPYDDKSQLKVFEHDKNVITWLVNNQIHLQESREYFNSGDCSFALSLCEHLLNKNPKILIGGLGLGTTVNTLARKIEEGKIDVVECVEKVIDFYKENADNNIDSKISLIKNDFYDYVFSSGEDYYDSVFMQLDFAGCSPHHREYQLCKQSNSRIYTKEFFQKMYSILRKDSCFIFDGISEVDGPITPMLNDCGFRTIEEVSPYWRPEIIDINHVTWTAFK